MSYKCPRCGYVAGRDGTKRGGVVLQAVMDHFSKLNAGETIEACNLDGYGILGSKKQYWNALTYLSRNNEIIRVDYGIYQKPSITPHQGAVQ